MPTPSSPCVLLLEASALSSLLLLLPVLILPSSPPPSKSFPSAWLLSLHHDPTRDRKLAPGASSPCVLLLEASALPLLLMLLQMLLLLLLLLMFPSRVAWGDAPPGRSSPDIDARSTTGEATDRRGDDDGNGAHCCCRCPLNRAEGEEENPPWKAFAPSSSHQQRNNTNREVEGKGRRSPRPPILPWIQQRF